MDLAGLADVSHFVLLVVEHDQEAKIFAKLDYVGMWITKRFLSLMLCTIIYYIDTYWKKILKILIRVCY